MTLFKYLPPERADVLQTRQFRYSPPAVFNDPFEARPHFTGLAPAAAWQRGYPQRFEKVLQDQYLAMNTAFRAEIPFAVFSVLLESQRPQIYEIFRTVDASFIPQINEMMHRKFAEGVGVFSLTEVGTDQLMWSHYAQSHRGFAIEFDAGHDYFRRRNIPEEELWYLHKVIYADRRPRTTVLELDMQAIFLTKHSAWNYEREWKDFRPLTQATKVVEAIPFPIHLFELPPGCFRRVILGARMEHEQKAQIISTLRSNIDLKHVEVCEAILDDRDYTMRVQLAGRDAEKQRDHRN